MHSLESNQLLDYFTLPDLNQFQIEQQSQIQLTDNIQSPYQQQYQHEDDNFQIFLSDFAELVLNNPALIKNNEKLKLYYNQNLAQSIQKRIIKHLEYKCNNIPSQPGNLQQQQQQQQNISLSTIKLEKDKQFQIEELEKFFIAKIENIEIKNSQSINMLNEKLLSFLRQTSNYFSIKKQKFDTNEGILHIAISKIDIDFQQNDNLFQNLKKSKASFNINSIIIVCGINSVEIELLYQLELFKLWNLSRSGIYFNQIYPARLQTLSFIMFNYLQSIRSFVSQQENNSATQKIKMLLLKNSQLLSQSQNQQQLIKELQLPEFSRCVIKNVQIGNYLSINNDDSISIIILRKIFSQLLQICQDYLLSQVTNLAFNLILWPIEIAQNSPQYQKAYQINNQQSQYNNLDNKDKYQNYQLIVCIQCEGEQQPKNNYYNQIYQKIIEQMQQISKEKYPQFLNTVQKVKSVNKTFANLKLNFDRYKRVNTTMNEAYKWFQDDKNYQNKSLYPDLKSLANQLQKSVYQFQSSQLTEEHYYQEEIEKESKKDNIIDDVETYKKQQNYNILLENKYQSNALQQQEQTNQHIILQDTDRLQSETLNTILQHNQRVVDQNETLHKVYNQQINYSKDYNETAQKQLNQISTSPDKQHLKSTSPVRRDPRRAHFSDIVSLVINKKSKASPSKSKLSQNSPLRLSMKNSQNSHYSSQMFNQSNDQNLQESQQSGRQSSTLDFLEFPEMTKRYLKNSYSFLNQTSQMVLQNSVYSQYDDNSLIRNVYELLQKMNLNLDSNIILQFKTTIELKKVIDDTQCYYIQIQNQLLPQVYKKFRLHQIEINKFQSSKKIPEQIVLPREFEYFVCKIIDFLINNLDKLIAVIEKENNQSNQEVLLDMFIFYIFNYFQNQMQKSLKFVILYVENKIIALFESFIARYINKQATSVQENTMSQQNQLDILISVLKKYFQTDIFEEYLEAVTSEYNFYLNYNEYEDNLFLTEIFQITFKIDLLQLMPKQAVYVFQQIQDQIDVYQQQQNSQKYIAGTKLDLEITKKYSFLAYIYFVSMIEPRLQQTYCNNFTSVKSNYKKEKPSITNIKLRKTIQYIIQNPIEIVKLNLEGCKNFFKQLKDDYKNEKYQSINHLSLMSFQESSSQLLQPKQHIQQYQQSISQLPVFGLKEFPPYQEKSNYLCKNFILESFQIQTLIISFKYYLTNTFFNKLSQEGTINSYLTKNPGIDQILKLLKYEENYVSVNLASFYKERQVYELQYQSVVPGDESKIVMTQQEMRRFLKPLQKQANPNVIIQNIQQQQQQQNNDDAIDNEQVQNYFQTQDQKNDSNNQGFLEMIYNINPNLKINDVQIKDIVKDDSGESLSINHTDESILNENMQNNLDSNNPYLQCLNNVNSKIISELIQDLYQAVRISNLILQSRKVEVNQLQAFRESVPKLLKNQKSLISYRFLNLLIENDLNLMIKENDILNKKIDFNK